MSCLVGKYNTVKKENANIVWIDVLNVVHMTKNQYGRKNQSTTPRWNYPIPGN